MQDITVQNLIFGNNRPFVLIAGPCQMESLSHGMEMAEALKNLTDRLGIPFVFKASFDKANRTSVNGIRGMGLEKGLQAFADIKSKFGCATITDVHEPYQCAPAAQVVDMRSLPIMKQTGYPVIFDATHSVQQPGGNGVSSGGQREFAPVLADAAITAGIAGIFIETHENPDSAPSDGPNMIPLRDMPAVLEKLMALDKIAKQP